MTQINRFKVTLISLLVWATCFGIYLLNTVKGRSATSALYEPVYAAPTVIDGYSPTLLLWIIILIGIIAFFGTIFSFILSFADRKK